MRIFIYLLINLKTSILLLKLFIIMGNCCTCKRQPKRKIVLLLVGLDNAGKTVAAKRLVGENINNSIPTVGFSTISLKFLNYAVNIYDLGGGISIRGIWHRYFVDAYGVIFVVDASDFDRFNEVKQVLEDLLSHEKISGKPILILANKQDNEEALDEIDLVEKLDLENLVNEKKCPTLVESCSAKEFSRSKKTDPSIERGYHWLLNFIINNYENLNKRVEQDMKLQMENDELLRKNKIAHIKNINDNSPSSSIRSMITGKKNLDYKRPKSATEIIRTHIEKSSVRNSCRSTNKTTPATIFNPKSAPVRISSHEFENNFRSTSRTGQIITVTELPNAIIDANGENIGDLFELNHFSSITLSPIKPKNGENFNLFHNLTRNKVGIIQNNIDDISKDISK